ncbi:hypothetical protein [Collimonas sp. OK242]|jgi:hypothetical protein|uniref:hypothetical protein n=1 Tax=Collimonas sp. OK242 TaxID=1798195 RepID=UPI000B8A44F9|nr:hypothetical protein [Collimonas sp. OK242]
MATLTVKFAVYGALNKGNQDASQVRNVKDVLQVAIDRKQGVVTINNTTMGGDPSVGNPKHFGAVVTLDSVDRYYACAEGQTIDFFHNKAPDQNTRKVALSEVLG